MPLRDIDTALLRTFLVLAETRSFSRTGERVGRSQSAVSGQIKKLEDTVGRVLIRRTTRSVGLTADGEDLQSYARRIIRTADAMLDHYRGGEIVGEVRFGSPEDFASAYLPDLLGIFAAAHEHVSLHVSCDLTLRLLDQFETGEQDLIIIKQDPAARHPGARVLWREELVWVASRSEVMTFDEARNRYAALERPLPLVVSPPPCVYRRRAAVALDDRLVPWAPVYSTQSHTGAVAAVKAGLGWAIMPRGMVPPDVAALDGHLGWPALAPAEIALVTAGRPTPAVAALASFVVEQAAGLSRRKPE
ncbi:MAG: LysR family transcriptional regulator [Burkholderiales bacterium]|nr:LysR family transcriptional regulator [Burkholderiales bacterium]